VVDTGRAENSAVPRGPRFGRRAGLAAAGFGLLIVTGFAWRRAALSGEAREIGAPAAAATTAADPKAASLEAPAPGAVEHEAAAAEAAPVALASASSAATAIPPESPVAVTAAAIASTGNSRHIWDIKQAKVPSLASHAPGAAATSGPTARNLTARPNRPPLPSSGL